MYWTAGPFANTLVFNGMHLGRAEIEVFPGSTERDPGLVGLQEEAVCKPCVSQHMERLGSQGKQEPSQRAQGATYILSSLLLTHLGRSRLPRSTGGLGAI